MGEGERVTHEDIRQDLVNGGKRFEALEKGQADILALLKPMQQDIAATKDIVEAWAVAKGVGNFIKWASGIAAGLLAIWALAKALAKGWV
jgi:hypothetical protein